MADPLHSPSPPPPQPQDLTPGHRATVFQTAFEKALDATLKKCSYDNFAACFPTIAERRGEVLREFWRNFTDRLNTVCKDEFQAILKERNVVASLNSLDRLVAEAKARKAAAEGSAEPVPPHTLPPAALLHAHLLPFLNEQESALTAALSTLETRNNALAETIQAQRAEMEGLVRGLEAVISDLERSGEMLQSDEVQGLLADVKMIDQELNS
ncbi:Nnf1-domain-containing protein [Trichodelitschia bisporula]|uniref:Nnf1-domain-containing protein n=1 Tax=Trichodelitschia bisporula TaxID=703511 RepID=A0A6G1HV69_9PEZI|nr:Nnf1-domain-containing protein [Trichodelitschia bisporula]